MRKYLFSIFCFVFATFIPIYAVIATFLLDDETFIKSMLLIACITPTLFLISIGSANMPKKQGKEEAEEILEAIKEDAKTFRELVRIEKFKRMVNSRKDLE